MKKKAKPSEKTEFSPRIFRAKPADWLGVAGIMVLGALVGLIISLFLPPKFEATAKLTTNLEVVTGTNVSEIMVDSQVDLVGTLLLHSDVVEMVRQSLEDQGVNYTVAELTGRTKIERQLMSTLIKVRDNDPEMAALIATTWAEKAYERLNEAYTHALSLSQAKATQALLTVCIKDTTKQALPFCQSLTEEKAAELAVEAKRIILQESPLSLGLTSELNISQYQAALTPDRPIAYQRSTLILAGALAGLVLALILGELLSKETERE